MLILYVTIEREKHGERKRERDRKRCTCVAYYRFPFMQVCSLLLSKSNPDLASALLHAEDHDGFTIPWHSDAQNDITNY